MADAPVAVGFGAGMLAAFNPCGFALLPAYLSYFVGNDGRDGRDGRGAGDVARALRVGAVVTGGFVVVFGAVGFAVTGMSLSVQRYTPWATLVIGLALAILGVAVVAGRAPAWSLPRFQRGGSDRGVGSLALFGASYATVSLSCTLPVFLAAVATSFRQESLGSGLAVFVAYAGGMGIVLTGLAVAVALARHSVLRRLRGVLAWVERASGALLAVAGAYIAWYGWFEVRLAAGADGGAGPIDVAGRLSGRVSTWIQSIGASRLGAGAAALVVIALLAERRRRSDADSGPEVRHEPTRGGEAVDDGDSPEANRTMTGGDRDGSRG